MSIKLNYSITETCQLTFSASTTFEAEKHKKYMFSLQVIDILTKNTIACEDVTLNKGKGTVKTSFNYSNYAKIGLSIKVNAVLAELSPSDFHQEPITLQETEAVPANEMNKIIDSTFQQYDLFGWNTCLDHIDFNHNISYCQTIQLTAAQTLTAHAAIYLKSDYRLVSIAKDSVDLTYNSFSPQLTITVKNNQITLKGNLDQKPANDVSTFCLKATACIQDTKNDFSLQLPVRFENS